MVAFVSGNGARNRASQDARGRRRVAKPAVRPTSSLVRGALFNRLGDRVNGAHILDLFAGTGGLGIEALRRNAARVVFVEHDAKLAAVIRSQLAKEAFVPRTEVWQRDALAAMRELARTKRRFDVVLLDPPYGEGWIPRVLHLVGETGILSPRGVVVAEGHWRDRPEADQTLVCTQEARYGETMLWYFRAREEGQGT